MERVDDRVCLRVCRLLLLLLPGPGAVSAACASFFEAPVHYGWHPVTHIPPNELNVWLPLCADCFSARREVRGFFFLYFLLFSLFAARNRIGTCIYLFIIIIIFFTLFCLLQLPALQVLTRLLMKKG